MRDADSPHPICGDVYAKLFMNEQGMEIFSRFGGERGPNVSNVARARYIDDLLRARLATNPGLQVVLIGCGFDTRAFRLNGGSWLELDDSQLIAYKNACLPAVQAANPLQRVAIDFDNESLRDKLQGLAGAVPTVFVIEGVTMYVTPEALRATLGILRSLFPEHEVIADLMTHKFIVTYGGSIRRIIAQLGAQMIPTDQPALPFDQSGYRELSSREIFGAALDYRSLGWLAPALRWFLSGLFSGYTVRVFRPA
jgi:methyltransferase (TIGR00027 family)